MSEQSKYINTYLDHSVGMIHEYISLVLQLKTQTKLANDGIIERDEIIKNLQNDLEATRSEYSNVKINLDKTIASDNEQINQLRGDASKWESEYNNMKAQVDHMNTAVNQINEMKRMILDKDKEISSLQKELENLKNPPPPPVKTAINTKDKKPVKPIEVKEVATVIDEKNDDF